VNIVTAPDTPPDEQGPPALAAVPAYDPAVHTVEDGNPLVGIELYCVCGDVRRFVDPVSHVLVQLADFEARHAGAGHGPATERDALAEREERRKAGFRMAGRQAEYEPRPHDVVAGEAHEWTPADPPPPDPAGGEQVADERDRAAATEDEETP
jgi:hypothetical protein